MKVIDSQLTRREGSTAGLAGMKWVEWEELQHQGKSKSAAPVKVRSKRNEGMALV